MDVAEIRRLLTAYAAGVPLPPIAGGEHVDPTGTGTGNAGPDAAPDAGLPDVGDGTGTGGGEASPPEDTFTLDGQTYAHDQVREALEALRTKTSWEKGYGRRDQVMAAVRKAVEQAFGKSVTELSAVDLRDLVSFGNFNAMLREDPVFADAWFESLTKAYRERGATPKQAEAAAARDVRVAQGPQGNGKVAEPAIPQALLQRLSRLEHVAQRWDQQASSQAIDRLASHVDQVVTRTITEVAKGLDDYHPDIRESVLYNLSGYTDHELVTMAQDGSLPDLVTDLAGRSAGRIRQRNDARQKAVATRVSQTRGTVPPKPFGGGPTQRAPERPEPQPGKGLAHLHERMRRALEHVDIE